MRKIFNLIIALTILVSGTVAQTKNQVKNFTHTDTEKILESVAELDLGTWNYSQNKQMHYGPTIEEFYKHLFPGQPVPDTLNVQDMAGVALIAIQALYQQSSDLKEQQKLLEETANRLTEENERNAGLSNDVLMQNIRITDLETKLNELSAKLDELKAVQK